jgi:hypothetical protein
MNWIRNQGRAVDTRVQNQNPQAEKRHEGHRNFFVPLPLSHAEDLLPRRVDPPKFGYFCFRRSKKDFPLKMKTPTSGGCLQRSLLPSAEDANFRGDSYSKVLL